MIQENQVDPDFNVEVHYIDKKINLENFIYTNPVDKKSFNLKEQLQIQIRKKLLKGFSFTASQTKVQILDEKVTKSGDSGNFMFDPFVNCVQIFLINNKGKPFEKYSLKFDSVTIVYKKVEKLDQNSVQVFSDDSTIDQILQSIGKQLKIEQASIENYKKLFRSNFLLKLSNIKKWEENQLSLGDKIPLVLAKEIHKVANKIDYFMEERFNSKKIKNKTEMEGSIRLANSHRVLRYLLFLNNKEALNKISYINYEAVKLALKVIFGELHLQKNISDNLTKFLYQFAIPHDKNYIYSKGAIFNGPPGTGKTVITELLMYLCGFTLISHGVSASDFSKSYVGEAGRMINDLFCRAECCPYLACSLAIDEVEGAFPDRNDSSEKNKGEATSQFLSVVEGNKNVGNLFIFSSTNHINKIDEAILRRLGDRFDLTRLNQEDRKELYNEVLLKSQMNSDNKKDMIGDSNLLVKDYLQKNRTQQAMLLDYTMNFTGAAFKKLLSQFQNTLETLVYLEGIPKFNLRLSNKQVQSLITKIALEYKITFGAKTLPELVNSSKYKSKFLNKEFLEGLENHFLFIGLSNSNDQKELKLGYIQKRNRWDGREEKQIQQLKFNVHMELNQDRNSIEEIAVFLIEELSSTFDCIVEVLNKVDGLNNAFTQIHGISSTKPVIYLFCDNRPRNERDLNKIIGFEKNKENVYIFYMTKDDFSEFRMEKIDKKYSGRIMAEVSKAPRIVFELETSSPKESSIYIQNQLGSFKQPKSDDLLPDVMQFFNQKMVSNIFMIDNYYIQTKNAFTPEKQIQTIRAVFDEARKLSNVAVIINFDSLLVSSKKKGNQENNSMESLIDDKSLYRSLVNACQDFSCQRKGVQRWLTMFVKNPQLCEKVRSDICWPEMPQEVKKRIEEEQLNRKRICYRCGQQYSEKENQEEKKCSQHPGIIMNTLLQKKADITFEEALIFNQMQQHQSEQGNKEKRMPTYIYSCCMANIKEVQNVCSKKHLYCHIEKEQQGTFKDELHNYRDSMILRWEKNIQHFSNMMRNGASLSSSSGSIPQPKMPSQEIKSYGIKR